MTTGDWRKYIPDELPGGRYWRNFSLTKISCYTVLSFDYWKAWLKKMGNSGKLLIKKKKENLRWCLPNTRGAKVWPNNIETRFSSERIIKTRKIKRTKKSSCEPYAHFNTPNCPSATLERPEHFLATTRTLQCRFTSKLGHRGHAQTSAAKITKESAVNHKEIDTNGVNRMLLRRPWRTDQKNRFLDKFWTPQFSTTPPKPFLLSFSTHLGDQTLARSIWKRSQLLDAFFRLAQGLLQLASFSRSTTTRSRKNVSTRTSPVAPSQAMAGMMACFLDV